ncbi:MAG: YdbL family protein [Alphaproteobacteria bacterium]
MKLRHVLNCFRRLVRGALPALAAIMLLATMLAPPADAASLNQLRQSGVLAERYDGYVVVRKKSGGAARTAAQINAKRRNLYAKRAKQQRVSVGNVGRVYARQIRSKAPRGTWFLDQNNRWQQKR